MSEVIYLDNTNWYFLKMLRDSIVHMKKEPSKYTIALKKETNWFKETIRENTIAA